MLSAYEAACLIVADAAAHGVILSETQAAALLAEVQTYVPAPLPVVRYSEPGLHHGNRRLPVGPPAPTACPWR
jgi:hypothetical protein